MPREIKFRAWAVASKVMFEPDTENGWIFSNGEVVSKPNTILMQFTGLKDKNGKEIYFGDIVKMNIAFDCAEVVYSSIGTVGLLQEKGVCFYWSTADWERCEIIGNKFENPDLLNNN